MTVTGIKLDSRVRDRLNTEARRDGVPVNGVLVAMHRPGQRPRSPASGRCPQPGWRPVVVVASDAYLAVVTTLVIAVPVTTVGRGWPNHVALSGPSGLQRPGWAMTEQPRTIDRGRLRGIAGSVDEDTVAAIDVWLRDVLELS